MDGHIPTHLANGLSSKFRTCLRKIFTSYLTFAFVIYSTPAPYAYANPVGGEVSAGSASIVESGNNLTVNQTSDKAVIDWRGFNIEAGETTHFNQPSTSSMTVNRVNSLDPSHIFGTLSANGNIMLLNQNGVLFGANSRVDVGGIVASTANISNADFMAGRMNFTAGNNHDATIENRGQITAAEAGLVGLVAPNVKNSGVISARLGRVHLASGDSFALDMYGDGLMSIGISDDVKSQVVENAGIINAAGGTIKMTAAAGRQMVNSLIKVDGMLNAPAVGQKNGKIYIFAEGSNAVEGNVAADKGVKGGNSTVKISGTLAASGKGAGETGGEVAVLGDRVALLSGSKIDASGDTGGGTVHVGGDYRGTGNTATAKTTIIQDGAEVNADAINNGKGGRVIAWADDYTDFSGSISVRGGSNSGDGGFVETSGKNLLKVAGTVNATSTYGKGGTWLLDPRNVTIAAAGATAYTESGGAPDTFTPTIDDTIILASTIKAQLDAGTSVVITTGSDGSQTGDITVSSAISKTAGGEATLTLQAAGSIIVNAAISSNSNKLNVYLNSDYDDSGSGNIQVTGGITTNNGNLIMGGTSSLITLGNTAAQNLAQATACVTCYAWGTATTSIATAAGVYITGITVGSGNLVIRGHGFNGAAASMNGIDIQSTSSITGVVNLVGVGGNGTTGNHGIEFHASSLNWWSSASNIISGTGGAGSGAGNHGIAWTGGGGGGYFSGIVTARGGAGTSGNYGFWNIGNQFLSAGTGYTLNAYGGNGSGNDNYGVYVATGVINGGGSTYTVNAYGGGQSGTSNNYGIYISAAGAGGINNASNVTVNINGTGGTGGAGSNNYGIYVVSGATITNSAGTMNITGTGGSGAASTYGVYVNSGAIQASGTGAINVTGTGGNGSGASNYGVYVAGASAKIYTSGSGNITVTGYGAGRTSAGDLTTSNSTENNIGVYVYNRGSIYTTSSGNVNIYGYGGNGTKYSGNTYGGNPETTNSNDIGVYINAIASVTSSSSGTVNITGVGGEGTGGGMGINFDTSSTISSTGGNITLTGTGGTNTNSHINGFTPASGNGGVFIQGVLSVSNNANIYIYGYGAGRTTVGNTTNINSGSHYGVYLGRAITLTGTSSISVTGIGGNGDWLCCTNGYNNFGIQVRDMVLTVANGTLTLNGTGGASTAGTPANNYSNYGVVLANSSIVQNGSGASGDVTITGTAGNGYAQNYGVYVDNNSPTAITVKDANLYITGHGGDGNNTNANYGVLIYKPITSTGTGNISITASEQTGALRHANSAGAIYLAGNITNATSTGTITLDASASSGFIYAAGGTVRTYGGAISLSGPITLAAALTLDTTNSTGTGSGVYAAGGNITIGSTVNGTYGLTLTAGTSGAANINGIIGGSTGLGAIAITAGTINLNAASIKTVASASNTVTLTGAVVLGSNLSIDTTNGGTAATTAGAINFTSTINGGYTLTTQAGTALTTFGGAIGGSTALNAISVSGNGNTYLYGNITTNNSNITFNNAVTFYTNETINAGTGTLTFGSTFLADATNTRSFSATAGTFTGMSTIGSSANRFTTVTLISSNDITVPTIYTTGDVTIQTSGTDKNITLSSAFTGASSGTPNILSSGTTTLSLKATGSVIVSNSITGSNNALNVLLNSDYDDSSAGNIQVTGAITTNGGYLSMVGGSSGTGYAYGTASTSAAVASGIYNTASLSTAGGNIIMNGIGFASSTAGMYGVYNSGAITNTGTARLTINGTGGAGSGGTNYGIYLLTNNITVGSETITGTGSAGASANNYGIYVGGITISSSDNATSTITGTGGSCGSGGGCVSNYGIYVGNSSLITASAGILTLVGNGGAGNWGFTADNIGIVAGSATISLTGTATTLNVTGNGGNGYSAGHGMGIYTNGTTITGTSGTINITGNGSVRTGSDAGWNIGIKIENSNFYPGAGGTLNVTGTGGSGWEANYGIFVGNGGVIKTINSGTVNVVGIGGSGINGAINNDGVYLVAATNASIFTSSSGNINITGTGGNIIGGRGVYLGAGSIYTSSSGNVNITGYGGDVAGSSSYGVYLASSVYSSGTGNISITASDQAAAHANATSGATTLYLASGASIYNTTSTGTISLSSLATGSQAALINVASAQTIRSSGGAISLTGPVTLGAALTLDTTNSGGAAAGAAITVGGTVNGAYGLTLTAGTSGLATFSGVVGGSTGLGIANITAGGGVTFNQSFKATTILADTTSGSGNITLNNSTILTGTAGGGSSITLATVGAFLNNSTADSGAGAGSGVFSTTGSARSLVYSADPRNDTYGNLARPTIRYNKTYAGYGPTFVTETGNVFLYTLAPTLTITANSANVGYGDDATLTGYGYNVSGLILTDNGGLSGTLTGTSTYSAGSNVGGGAGTGGTYNINYSSGSLASTMGYQFTYANNANAITVTQRAITIAATAGQTKVYGASDGTLGYSITSGSLSSVGASKDLTGALARAAGEDVSTYAINQGTLANSNYAITFTGGTTYAITPAALTITATAKTMTYGDGNTYNGVTYTAQNGETIGGITLASGADSSLSGSGNWNAGSYTITASAVVDNGAFKASNYNITYATGALTINTKSLTVAATGVNRAYNGNTTATVNLSDNRITNDVFTTNYSAATFADQNAATGIAVAVSGITKSGGDSANYTLAATTASTTANITAAGLSLTIAADAKSKVYGAVDPTLTYAITAGSLVGGDLLTGDLARAVGESVGSYAITQGTLSAGSNYIITYNGSLLTITAAALNVIADAKTKVAGAANPAFTYSYNGLVNGDTAAVFNGSLASLANTGSGAGIYAITIGSLLASNYTINFTGNNLTVSAAQSSGSTPAIETVSSVISNINIRTQTPSNSQDPGHSDSYDIIAYDKSYIPRNDYTISTEVYGPFRPTIISKEMFGPFKTATTEIFGPFQPAIISNEPFGPFKTATTEAFGPFQPAIISNEPFGPFKTATTEAFGPFQPAIISNEPFGPFKTATTEAFGPFQPAIISNEPFGPFKTATTEAFGPFQPAIISNEPFGPLQAEENFIGPIMPDMAKEFFGPEMPTTSEIIIDPVSNEILAQTSPAEPKNYVVSPTPYQQSSQENRRVLQYKVSDKIKDIAPAFMDISIDEETYLENPTTEDNHQITSRNGRRGARGENSRTEARRMDTNVL